MKIICINSRMKYKNGYAYLDELSEYDLKEIPSGTSVFVYWYAGGMYEGSGHAISEKDGFWYLRSLSHCSCYGPCEDGGRQFQSLEALVECASKCEDWEKEVKPLVEALKES